MPGNHQTPCEAVAIVGSACRFPGDASSPSSLWQLLREPRDVLSEIPPSRFNLKKFYHPDGSHHGTTSVRHSYLLSDDHRLFDAQFFGTKPVEAISMDPQQRLLLETVYEGLERAGIPMEQLQGSNTGVFVGLMTDDYASIVARDIQNVPTYCASGTARSILSNRVSYFFDWRGPSMTIDTACSSSLIAMHQAVQSLRNGESDVVVAAGTNLLLAPEQFVAESKLNMLSPSGRSRMWDKDADGYARGDGIAVVVLKRVNDALANSDHIECLVRETGINQDGHTKGITMPSPMAQMDLIRTTYARAGLDLSKACDRPQFFEAHGTGTPAGDPVEAEAISTAFFGPTANYRRGTQDYPLYVGSIKTVIGHTEGTAGLAGVLKVSLALQNGIVPPNLLLNELSSTVRPFYKDLEIVSKAQKWPPLPKDSVRRASVNSFGFGGANAHAILEAFNGQEEANSMLNARNEIISPFNFSASCEKSLFTMLRLYSKYVETHPDVDLHDLSWTLNSRRSTLPVRLSISVPSKADLLKRLEATAESPSNILSGSQTKSTKNPKLIGIFTGQGAQWARMGAELIESSPLVEECIRRLDRSLQTLPKEHRPQWSLRDEILKNSESSRVGEAAFSQPLCTAVQIVLIELLSAASIRFTAVVGHSSGEIAAAYAAGYLSAEDAIRVAYYRGWSLQYVKDKDGKKGAMMAVGTSYEDAQELCETELLKNRVCLAAFNSSTSVTLSGDADAIEEAKEILDDEKKFARVLNVDKAYHSHHMIPASAPYITALQNCGVSHKPRPNGSATWISSVYGEAIEDVKDSLADTYWSSNMVNPVLFSQAVKRAVSTLGPFDMALEIGPHPALKGPTIQTIQEVSGHLLPYTGTLTRGMNARQAFASALGSLWASLGGYTVEFSKFEDMVTGNNRRPKLLKDLPSYPWDHERIYWHQSRSADAYLNDNDSFHQLLGTRCPDGTDKNLRWRNYLHVRELPWLMHHQVQGQMVFPAAAYISAAVESVITSFGLDSVQLIDFRNVTIGQALVLEENTGVETSFTLSVLQKQNHRVLAEFSCYSHTNKGSSVSLHASGELCILLGEPTLHVLPSRTKTHGEYLALETDRFYNSVTELGFQYTGPFRALSGLSRKMDEATGSIEVATETSEDGELVIHPAPLDAAIQSTMLAYCFPGDGRLRTLYLPTRIDRLRLNPSACFKFARPGASLQFDSSSKDGEFSELYGDVNIYSIDGKCTLVQLEGMHTKALSPMTAANDVPLFTEITWAVDDPTRLRSYADDDRHSEELSMFSDLERVAHFYLKNLSKSIQHSELSSIAWNHSHLLSYAEHCASVVASGTHPFANPEWAHDTKEDITAILNHYSESIDVQVMTKIGDRIPGIVQGEMELNQVLGQDTMLSDFYTRTLGIQSYLEEVTVMARHVSHRYPHVNVLEIGAGASIVTDKVVRAMDTAFASYTYTDITDMQFDDLRHRLSEYQSRMSYKTLDIEKDIVEQGFKESSFDVVIACFALYATRSIEKALSNVRRLLKPGGFLLLVEITSPNVMRFGLVLGALPSSWLGYDEGRSLSPFVSESRWDELMKQAGFSGLEALNSTTSNFQPPFSAMATQALDHRVRFLREPLASTHEALDIHALTIIGGKTELTASIVSGAVDLLQRHYRQIRTVVSLDDLVTEELPVMGTVISLIELDESLFTTMTPRRLSSFQELFKKSKNVLWLAHGAQGDNPYCNMFLGVRRTLVLEMSHLHIQFLNLHSIEDTDGQIIAKKTLQLEIADIWEQRDQLNDLLWYNEPELSLQNGMFLVPRYRLSETRNSRYNSAKRLIIQNVDRSNSVVTIERTETGYKVREKHSEEKACRAGHIEVNVTHSLLQPIRITPSDSSFLVFGKAHSSGGFIIALSDSLDSRIYVPQTWTLQSGHVEDQGIFAMLELYDHLLAISMLNGLLPEQRLAVLNPSTVLTPILTRYAKEKGVHLLLLSTKKEHLTTPWTSIHRHSTGRELGNILSHKIARFVNLGGDEDMDSVLRDCLPLDCEFEDKVSLTNRPLGSSRSPTTYEVGIRLRAAWVGVQSEVTQGIVHGVQTLSLHHLMKSSHQTDDQTLIAWGDSQLPVQVQPASRRVKFARNKTYWLVGLTGGLGLSLCKWMIRQGAQHIALSSRNPNVSDKWLEKITASGCTVRVFSTDITNRDSVHATHRQILKSMPPIAGVAQGAMVLQDTMFIDLDLSRLEKVLLPKVEGSIILDELFSDNTLDFLIFFSSMAAITGNQGQVAYNAANMFMTSLASQRQKRGLRGQAIHIGAIVGNGYVTRELNMAQQTFLYRMGHTWMSEQDFHEVFAEGVLTSADNGESSQICSGLRIDDDLSKGWVTSPMFQHLVFKESILPTEQSKDKGAVVLKLRLLEASSHQEVINILEDAFILKLQSALQADPGKPMLDMSPDELGVDSLVAVDLRSWFLKELTLDIPVLKIFNSRSIRDLLAYAANTLPGTLIPKLESHADPMLEGEKVSQTLIPGSARSPEVGGAVHVTDPAIENEKEGLTSDGWILSQYHSGGSTTSISIGDPESDAENESISSMEIGNDVIVKLKTHVERTLPISFGHSRFWSLQLLDNNKTAFNVTITFNLKGQLRVNDFKKAIDSLGANHEALRTCFFTSEGKPRQGVLKKSKLQLEHIKITHASEVEEFSRKLKMHEFNLSEGEILRIQLLSLTKDQHWIIIGFHHINMDGISLEILLSGIEDSYNGAPVAQDTLQYPDYTLRQLREYKNGAWKLDLDYLRARFNDALPMIPLLPFSLRSTRPTVAQFKCHTARIRLDTEISQAIEKCCQIFKTSPMHFYLTTWQIMVLRLFELNDVCIGFGDGNRGEKDVRHSVGLYFNILPLRFYLRSSQSFSEAMKETKISTQDAFSYSRVPFDVIVSELDIPRSISHNPLTQILFNYRPKIAQTRSFCGCVANGDLWSGGETAFDLSLDVGNFSTGETFVLLSVQQGLYEMGHAEMLLRSYYGLLQSFVHNPAVQVVAPGIYPETPKAMR